MLKIEEYKIVREFIKKKSVLLMDHEKKNHAKVGIAINNYEVIEIGEKRFYVIPTNMFKAIIERNIIIASTKFPERFGNGNAKDVIKAIYDLEPWFTLERFIEILQTEQFCYIVEIIDGEIQEKLLRIDLYRDIKENSIGGSDFIGGIFHCYKHYSFQGLPLSTNKEINDLENPKELVYKIINAFFTGKVKEVDENTFVSEVEINENEKLRLVFYYEKITGVYFVKTAHKV